MKRYVLLMVILVLVDQLLGWAANTAFANGQQVLVVRAGRWDHAAPIGPQVPLFAAHIITLFMLAALCRLGMGGRYYMLFGLPIALIASALITQTIDGLARGYSVNYVGLGSEGWVVKFTDTATQFAWLYTALLFSVGLFKHFRKRSRHRTMNVEGI